MSSARRISRTDGLLAGLAVLSGIFILTYRAPWQGYWYDEYVTLMFTRMSWYELLVEHWGADTHRPVYYALQKAWIALFGTGVGAVRSLPAVLILPVVPLFFLVARRIGPAAMAPIAALLVATAPMFVYQGREVRMYALVTLALAVSLLLAMRLAERARARMRDQRAASPGNMALWGGFAAAMAVAFYAQPLAILIAVLYLVWILICVARGDLPASFLGASLAAGGFYLVLILPALFPFFTHAANTLGENFWIPSPSLKSIYLHTATAYAYPKWIKPVVLLLILWGLWSLRDRPHIFWLLALMVVGLPALVLLISFWKPIYIARVIAWSPITATLVMASGLAVLRPSLRWPAVAVLLFFQITGSMSALPASPERDGAAVIARHLGDLDPERDVLVLRHQMTEPALRWFNPEVFETADIYGFTPRDWTGNVFDSALRSAHVRQADAASIPRPEGRLWLVSEFDPTLPPEPSMDAALETVTHGLGKQSSIAEGDFRLDIYSGG